jgi:spermidine synthase
MIEFARLLSLSKRERELPCDLPSCQLFEGEGYRWLRSSEGAIQTAMHLDDPTVLVLPNHRAMMLATLLVPKLRYVLDLGSGGGGFVRHLRALSPAPVVTAVENDGDMLDLARRHFDLAPQQLVHVGDAMDFLGRDRARYDLILCDLFSDRISPAAFGDPPFFASLQRRLNPGAAIAVNTLPASLDELARIVEAAVQCFAGVGILQMPELGNVLLFLQETVLPDAAELGRRLATSRYVGQADLQNALAALRRIE